MSKENQYNQIIQLWKNERQTIELLEIKSITYSTIRQMISSLEKELLKKTSTDDIISCNVIKKRIERLNKILRDLTKTRLHKIIHGILNGNLNTAGLAAEEIDLVKNLERVFEEHNNRSMYGKFSMELVKDEGGVATINESKTVELMTIRILEDIPEIIDATAKGEGKKSYGPFKKEDIVRLPLIYAKTLIMKNAADRVDIPDL